MKFPVLSLVVELFDVFEVQVSDNDYNHLIRNFDWSG